MPVTVTAPAPLLRESGFTLLELVAVVFILSIVAAVAIPSLSRPVDRLHNDASHLASTFRHVTDQAIMRKEVLVISFDLQHQNVSHTAEGDNKARHIPTLYGVETPSTGLLTEEQTSVFINPESLGEPVTVYLQQEDKALFIRYNPISRRTTVLDELP